jgi:hypothetical protein
MFSNFSYEKSIDEIKEAMGKKITFLTNKITEREQRILRLRQEFDISDAELIDLLTQYGNEMVSNSRVSASMSYALNKANGGDQKIIGAGVVQNLMTEKSLIETEKDSIEKMERISRNLRPVRHITPDGTEWFQNSFRLSEDELEYLGF